LYRRNQKKKKTSESPLENPKKKSNVKSHEENDNKKETVSSHIHKKRGKSSQRTCERNTTQFDSVLNPPEEQNSVTNSWIENNSSESSFVPSISPFIVPQSSINFVTAPVAPLSDEQLAHSIQEREYVNHRRSIGLINLIRRHPQISANPFSFLLSIMDRDFNENDYEMLLKLDEGNESRRGASPSQIASLPIQFASEIDECCICLSSINEGSQIRKLNCSHIYHVECIDKWLKVNKVCPIDKKNIFENC